MQDTAPGATEMVATTQRLSEVVELASRSPLVALDLEANGFHRYPERVCLLQLAVPGAAFLIDPLAVPDMGSFGKLLADPSVEKVFHSADYDVRSLDRDWGFRIRNLFDTSIAAAFTGSTRLGLGAVAEDLLDVVLNKEKRLQRADWTLRPLGPEQQRYAAADVLYLERVRDILAERLGELGRSEWVAEECKRLSGVRHEPRDPEWAFLSVKGSRDLDGRGLAVLRSLHLFREREAVRRDRPPFKVLSDSVLVAVAGSPDSGPAGIKGLGPFGRPPGSAQLGAAVRDGLRARLVSRPRPTRRGPSLSAAERSRARERLQRLKEWRTGHGKRLVLDSGLLWPAISLERLSIRPDTLDDELGAPEVRDWQRRELAESLRGQLQTLGDR